MYEKLDALTIEGLRHEVHETKAAIFAYEISGDTNRIDTANKHLAAVYAELSKRNNSN
jgi:hypothetical protein